VSAEVFRIRWDVRRFQAYLYDIPGPLADELRCFAGTPKAERWTPQPVYSDHPRLERPDIWHLIGVATMVMDAGVVQQVEPWLIEAGELLPLVVSGTGETVYALNILQDVDCIDPVAFSLDEMRLQPVFLEHRLPESGLFKLPQVDTVDMFYVERDDEQETFRARIEERGLTGLDFQRVWSSEDGPARMNMMRE
jgi:hypothetical protein